MKILIVLITLGLAACSENDIEKNYENAKDKAEDTVSDIRREACETINGKVECAVEEAGRSLKDTVDETKETAQELTE